MSFLIVLAKKEKPKVVHHHQATKETSRKHSHTRTRAAGAEGDRCPAPIRRRAQRTEGSSYSRDAGARAHADIASHLLKHGVGPRLEAYRERLFALFSHNLAQRRASPEAAAALLQRDPRHEAAPSAQKPNHRGAGAAELQPDADAGGG